MRVDYQVIKRYLDGIEQKGDRELILQWFSDLRAESDLRIKYKKYWEDLSREQDLSGYDGDMILNRIYHDIKLKECSIKPGHRIHILNKIVNVVSKAAAVLLIPLLAYVFIQRDNYISHDSQTALTEIYSPLGTRTQFYLPDGSKGWLNGGSYLEFPVEFKGKTRDVVLRGEACFNVKSNPKKPFVVSGLNISVAAYGTVFNVYAYPDDRQCKVTLVNGSARVGGKLNGQIRNAKMLQPNRMYTYDRVTNKYDIRQVDAYQIVAWKEGKMVFKDEPLSEVVRRLNRWYNIDIVIIDKVLESYVYLATFEDETIDEVLKLLELSAPIEYKDLGRKRKNDGSFTKRKIELYFKSE